MERSVIVEYIQESDIPLNEIYRQVFKSNGSHYAIGSIRKYVRGGSVSDDLVNAMEEWYTRELDGLPHRPSKIRVTYSGFQAPDTPLYVLIERRNRARDSSSLREAQMYDDIINGRMLNIIGNSQRSDCSDVQSYFGTLGGREQ